MKVYRTWFILLLVASAVGCSSWFDKPSGSDPGPAVEAAGETAASTAEDLQKSSGRIRKDAYTIKDEADKTEAGLPAAQKDSVRPHLSSIKGSADSILEEAGRVEAAGKTVTELSGDLQRVSKDIKAVVSQNRVLQKKIKSLETANAELAKNQTSFLNKAMVALVVLGVVVLGISGALVLSGNPKAIAGAIGSVILIGSGLGVMALTQHLWVFAVIGGLGILVLFIVLGIHIKEHLEVKRGFEENVELTEEIKEELSDTIRTKLFGDARTNGRAGEIQHPSTLRLVSEARKKARLKNAFS